MFETIDPLSQKTVFFASSPEGRAKTGAGGDGESVPEGCILSFENVCMVEGQEGRCAVRRMEAEWKKLEIPQKFGRFGAIGD